MVERTAFVIGILIIFLPMIGIFSEWKEWALYVMGGILVFHAGYSMLFDKE